MIPKRGELKNKLDLYHIFEHGFYSVLPFFSRGETRLVQN